MCRVTSHFIKYSTHFVIQETGKPEPFGENKNKNTLLNVPKLLFSFLDSQIVPYGVLKTYFNRLIIIVFYLFLWYLCYSIIVFFRVTS